MSSLFVYHQSSPEQPHKVLSHAEDIASTLAEHGVTFERLQAAIPLGPQPNGETVLSVYREQLDELMTTRGYAAVDVISAEGDGPHIAALRASFLDEHCHDEDETRFFVAGRGLLSLHINDFVYAVLCEKNDLMTSPAGIRRWFDIGEHPRVVAIRLFTSVQGQAVRFTGETIASEFAQLDDL